MGTVIYGQGPNRKPIPAHSTEEGGWNLRGLRFTKPGASLNAWAVVNLAGPPAQQGIPKFVNALVDMLKRTGASFIAPLFGF